MLIVRDWRTRVLTEAGLINPPEKGAGESIQYADVVVADLDSFVQNINLFQILNQYLAENPSLIVIGVGSKIEPPFFNEYRRLISEDIYSNLRFPHRWHGL